jgi:hypothetical protein
MFNQLKDSLEAGTPTETPVAQIVERLAVINLRGQNW